MLLKNSLFGTFRVRDCIINRVFGVHVRDMQRHGPSVRNVLPIPTDLGMKSLLAIAYMSHARCSGYYVELYYRLPTTIYTIGHLAVVSKYHGIKTGSHVVARSSQNRG